MSIDMRARPLARSDITVQVIGDEVMLYDSDNEKIHVLNHSAYAIWQLCNGENSLADMCEHLAVRYTDSSLDLIDDIKTTIDEFIKKGLLI
jgi:Coenzyme PQQ synthesis protein D (PqqD)